LKADFLPETQVFAVDAALAGQTALAILRRMLPGQSWSACRKCLESRRVTVNGVLCVNEARRLQTGDEVRISSAPQQVTSVLNELALLFVDEHIVVVEKPAGIVTFRRPDEQNWPQERKRLQPTLDELVLDRLSQQRRQLWRVQRLDRDTSGLVLFARTQRSAEKLIPQFAAHTVERVYYAVVLGKPSAQTIRTHLVRDRGDGLRGSSRDGKSGQLAITHVRPLQSWGDASLVECRLETGRTHQIRIHLAEIGHPVCGDDRYRRRKDGVDVVDLSGAPRLALHAIRLGFDHPRTGERLQFMSTWPTDLARWRTI